eukprot:5404549-Alexandrium_andersonii.AAC.1
MGGCAARTRVHFLLRLGRCLVSRGRALPRWCRWPAAPLARSPGPPLRAAAAAAARPWGSSTLSPCCRRPLSLRLLGGR